MMWGSAPRPAALIERARILDLFENGRYLSVETYTVRPRIQGTDALGKSTGQSPTITPNGALHTSRM
jgi:hypothetical protein